MLDRAPQAQSTGGAIGTPQNGTQHATPRVVVVSGADETAFRRSASALATYVQECSQIARSHFRVGQLNHTVNRRTLHQYRAVLTAYDAQDLTFQLLDVAELPPAARKQLEGPRPAFVFSGQGAQYYSMGRELILSCPVFVNSLQKAGNVLRQLGCDWDLLAELQQDMNDSRVNSPAVGQPMSTCLQLALVDMLNSLDIYPECNVGHMSGETAAAYSAGAPSFADAITVSYHRGRLTEEMLISGDTQRSGAMLAVGLSPEQAESYISRCNCGMQITVACYNSPSAVTLSGDASAVDDLARALETDHVFHRKLKTNGAAYHSDHMRGIEKEYFDALKHIKPRRPTRRMISTLTGIQLWHVQLDAEYWVANLLSPVRFTDAIQELVRELPGRRPIDVLVEVGPHSQLGDPVKQILQGAGKTSDAQYFSVLKRNTRADESLLQCVGGLFALGAACKLHFANNEFQNPLPRLLTDIPSYPFDHEQRYWHESRLSKEYRHRQFSPHELIGSLSADINHLEPTWRQYLSLKEIPWLADIWYRAKLSSQERVTSVWCSRQLVSTLTEETQTSKSPATR